MKAQPLRRLERRFNLGRYLEVEIGKEENVAVTCPVCDKEDKLWILTQDKRDNDGALRRAGSFICYYCYDQNGDGCGGGPLELIQWMEDKDFLAAIVVLAHNGDAVTESDFIETVKAALAELDEEGEDEVEKELPEIDWPENYEKIGPHNAPKYMLNRGISVKKAARYKIGLCRTGWFRKRLIVPTIMNGKLVGFQARYMKKVPPKALDPKTGETKRLKKVRFPKGTKTGRMLFNYDKARKCERIYIVEDPFSAMRIGKSAVATFGTSLSPRQLELLLESDAEEVVVVWDRDALRKSYELAQLLSEFWQVRVVELPDERDVDEYKSTTELREVLDSAPIVGAADTFAGVASARLAEALEA